jgi:hypothetical protein
MEVFTDVHLVTLAQIGDAVYLAGQGIELAIGCQMDIPMAHDSTIGSMTINIEENGDHPNWMVRGMAKLLAEEVYQIKVVALGDQHGGLRHAAYMLVCAVAQKQSVSFDAARTIVENGVDPEELQLTAELVAQGQALYP